MANLVMPLSLWPGCIEGGCRKGTNEQVPVCGSLKVMAVDSDTAKAANSLSGLMRMFCRPGGLRGGLCSLCNVAVCPLSSTFTSPVQPLKALEFGIAERGLGVHQ